MTQIVREALSVARFEPAVLGSLAADIDRAAKEDKKLRLKDRRWRRETQPDLPNLQESLEPADLESLDADALTLDPGRPRAITPEVLLVVEVANGVFPVTSLDGYDRLVGSQVFRAVVGEGRRMPARSTLGKYLGVVSDETRTLLHRAVCRMVEAEGLDTFEELTVDSTAVEANSAWPTESALITGFLTRIHRLLDRQTKYTGVPYGSKLVDRWLKDLARFHRAISMLPRKPGSAAKRRKLYAALLRTAGKTRKKLQELLARRRDAITTRRMLPSFRVRVNRILEQMASDFAEVDKAMDSARRRVLEGEKVPAAEKTFSLSDPDAYMIEKGQRDPIVGYKPQLGKSGNGFITCFEVQRGNPCDSERLKPMLDAHIEATGVRPALVSTDDGYSSAANFNELCTAGVELISFSGAKGRKVLGDDLYELDVLAEVRNERSAVESVIFTFKQKFGMRRFCRRGLSGVRKDLSAAVLAYNLWRMGYVREAMRRARGSPGAGVGA